MNYVTMGHPGTISSSTKMYVALLVSRDATGGFLAGKFILEGLRWFGQHAAARPAQYLPA